MKRGDRVVEVCVWGGGEPQPVCHHLKQTVIPMQPLTLHVGTSRAIKDLDLNEQEQVVFFTRLQTKTTTTTNKKKNKTQPM